MDDLDIKFYSKECGTCVMKYVPVQVMWIKDVL